MKTTIYYFSATGNSLQFARNIADKLGDSELISIPKANQQETTVSASGRIGLIFPVYAWGIPRIVVDFIKKLSLREPRYIFAISTCVAIPGNTLLELKAVLKQKGLILDAGFAVQSGRSILMKLNALDEIIKRIDFHRKRMGTGEMRLNEIVSTLKNLEKHRPETSSRAANIFGSMFHNLALKSFQTEDKNFIVNVECNGCGNCAKVCPRNNISMENCRPAFHHDCELCHACIQWCPKFAIQHPNFDTQLTQYHNPEIKMKDLLVA